MSVFSEDLSCNWNNQNNDHNVNKINIFDIIDDDFKNYESPAKKAKIDSIIDFNKTKTTQKEDFIEELESKINQFLNSPSKNPRTVERMFSDILREHSYSSLSRSSSATPTNVIPGTVIHTIVILFCKF